MDSRSAMPPAAVQRGRLSRGLSTVAVVASLSLLAAACGGGTAPAAGGSGTTKAAASSGALPLSTLATYQKANRQQVLVAQADHEGALDFYTTNTWMAGPVVKAFEKAYPQIKVHAYRADTQNVITRVVQAASAHRRIVDVVEDEPQGLNILAAKNLLQPMKAPGMSAYPSTALFKNSQGVIYWEDREIYVGVGYNTQQVPAGQQPKTFQDLLNPRWKGKMVMAGSSTGVNWLGIALTTLGSGYVNKLKQQNIRVQDISGAALAQLVAAGQVALSPTIYNSNVRVLQRAGKPIGWQPLQPVYTSTGYMGVVTSAPHPAAALLFMDYVHSTAGQKVEAQGSLSSPRTDMASSGNSFQKFYFEHRFTQAQYVKDFSQWQQLLKQDFIAGS